jgi:hypothetical protein
MSSMRFYAYITCGGSVTVFGFISISVCFILCLTYEQYGEYSSLYGTASLTLSVKIGFFEKSFTLTFSKRIMGTDKPGASSETVYNLLPDNSNERDKDYAGNGGNIFHQVKYIEGEDMPPQRNRKGDTIFTSCGWEQFCYSFS